MLENSEDSKPLEQSHSVQCLWVQLDYQISCKISSQVGDDTNILCLVLSERCISCEEGVCDLCDCVMRRSLAGTGDKMSLRIMWLPSRYEEVNYIPWFIIWKFKTHSFSNLIPSPMEQCSLWAKLANNVTKSNADVISYRGLWSEVMDESPMDRCHSYLPVSPIPLQLW